jgi:hypothetical protein
MRLVFCCVQTSSVAHPPSFPVGIAVQTSSVAHPASSPVGAAVPSPEDIVAGRDAIHAQP